MPPWVSVVVGLLGVVFGAGVAWGLLRGKASSLETTAASLAGTVKELTHTVGELHTKMATISRDLDHLSEGLERLQESVHRTANGLQTVRLEVARLEARAGHGQ